MKLKKNLAIIFLFATILNAQSDSLRLTTDEIKALADKLGVKLLLNDKQKSDLTAILSGYSSEISTMQLKGDLPDEKSEAVIENIDEKILLNFDEKQKMKYEIIKMEWWGQVISEGKD